LNLPFMDAPWDDDEGRELLIAMMDASDEPTRPRPTLVELSPDLKPLADLLERVTIRGSV